MMLPLKRPDRAPDMVIEDVDAAGVNVRVWFAESMVEQYIKKSKCKEGDPRDLGILVWKAKTKKDPKSFPRILLDGTFFPGEMGGTQYDMFLDEPDWLKLSHAYSEWYTIQELNKIITDGAEQP